MKVFLGPTSHNLISCCYTYINCPYTRTVISKCECCSFFRVDYFANSVDRNFLVLFLFQRQS